MNIYDVHNYDLKNGVYMDEDGCGSSVSWNIYQMFHLMIWFFQFINEITFRWDYLLWKIVFMLYWIDIWTKLRNYRFLQTQSSGIIKAMVLCRYY